MNHPMSMERLRNIEGMISTAQNETRYRPGTRVFVTCGAGAVISGSWVETEGRRETTSVVVYDDAGGAVTTTRIDIESVAGVGTTVEAAAPVHGMDRIPPSRRTMGIASVILQLWGQVNDVPTYGDLRTALDDIDGSGADLGGRGSDDLAIDAIDPCMVGRVDKVLLHIAARSAPGHVLERLDGMSVAEVLMNDHLKDAVMEDALLKDAMMAEMDAWTPMLMGEEEPKQNRTIADLPADLRQRAIARMRLANVRLRMEREYHPFIERGRLLALVANG